MHSCLRLHAGCCDYQPHTRPHGDWLEYEMSALGAMQGKGWMPRAEEGGSFDMLRGAKIGSVRSLVGMEFKHNIQAMEGPVWSPGTCRGPAPSTVSGRGGRGPPLQSVKGACDAVFGVPTEGVECDAQCTARKTK